MPSACVDSDHKLGGGREHDILVNARCADGYYGAVVASPPCSTFSVSRLYRSPDAPDVARRWAAARQRQESRYGTTRHSSCSPTRTPPSERNRQTHCESITCSARRWGRIYFGTSG
eukprot:1168275-Pleurochrysis_carterae.AAC.1